MQTLKAIRALFFLVQSMFTLIFGRNNYKPIYRVVSICLEHPSMQRMLEQLRADPEVQSLLRDRYREDQEPDWEMIRELPEGTLGREYYRFMDRPEVTPINKLPEQSLRIHPEIDYLRARIRFIHDIHHVITGHPSTEIGEMGISAFYVAQISSPLNAVLMAVGLIKCTIKAPEKMTELMEYIVEGYAMGKRAKQVSGIRFEDWWALPVSEVRRRLDVIPTVHDFVPAYQGTNQDWMATGTNAPVQGLAQDSTKASC